MVERSQLSHIPKNELLTTHQSKKLWKKTACCFSTYCSTAAELYFFSKDPKRPPCTGERRYLRCNFQMLVAIVEEHVSTVRTVLV